MVRRVFIVALMVMVAFVANAQKRVMYAGSFTYADNI